jgi:hypothetical protein
MVPTVFTLSICFRISPIRKFALPNPRLASAYHFHIQDVKYRVTSWLQTEYEGADDLRRLTCVTAEVKDAHRTMVQRADHDKQVGTACNSDREPFHSGYIFGSESRLNSAYISPECSSQRSLSPPPSPTPPVFGPAPRAS